MSGEQTSIKVVVRVRPYNRHELNQKQQTIIKVMDSKTMLFDPEDEDDEFFYQGTKQNYRDISKRVHKKITMEFDRVFDTDSTNSQVFEECTAPLVESVLNGYNCSVFVYGATGAGKTFTMLGNAGCPGLTFLTMKELFRQVEEQKVKIKFDVGVSYLEVYNENVMNLLTKSGPLKLQEDTNGVIVSGLALKPIHNADQLLDLLAFGNSHRTQHPTDANAESSRSHAIFQVHIRTTDRQTGQKRTVKLSMIDLAGSERAASTKGIGLRFKEGASINKSLLALGNCINKLADGQKHIPYRDSNLTRILKDSLGGNCRTLMIANVSMSSLTYDDTYNTLKYASRAKTIRTILRQNVMKTNMPKDFYVKKVVELMAENERLKAANKDLEVKVQKSSNDRTCYENDLITWYNKIDAVYASTMKMKEYMYRIESRLKNMRLRNKFKIEWNNYECLLLGEEPADCNYKESTDKDMVKSETELERWREKLQVAYKDVEKLNQEINESKYANILRIYQKKKQAEEDNSAMAKINHLLTVNSQFVSNSSSVHKMCLMACEYLKGSDNENIDKLLSSIKSGKDKNEEALIESKRLINGTSNGMINTLSHSKAKRPCISTTTNSTSTHNSIDSSLTTSDDEINTSGAESLSNAGTFKIPLQKKLNSQPLQSNFNITHILTNPLDFNNTFLLDSKTVPFEQQPSSSSTTRGFKKNLINGILSDQIVQGPTNKDYLKNALLKSKNFNHTGLIKTITAGVHKENFRRHSPGKIRKSPRNGATKVLVSTTNLVKKQLIRPIGGTSLPSEPVVRSNRAASFRAKKQ